MELKEKLARELNAAKRGFATSTLECRCFEPKRKDFEATAAAAREHGVNMDDITVSKETVIDPKIKATKTILNRARNYHYAATRPWAGRKVGIIRGQDLLEYAQAMNGFIKDFKAAVEAAASDWGMIVMEQQERLGPLFRIEDYPTAEQFKAKFSLRYYLNQLPDKSDWLLDVDEDAVAELAGSFENQMSDRLNELRNAVLTEAMESLKGAEATLRKGSPQGIRNALVNNVRDTMSWVKDLNISDDDEIRNVVASIEKYVVDVGADELRENEHARFTAVRQIRNNIRRIGDSL